MMDKGSSVQRPVRVNARAKKLRSKLIRVVMVPVEKQPSRLVRVVMVPVEKQPPRFIRVGLVPAETSPSGPLRAVAVRIRRPRAEPRTVSVRAATAGHGKMQE